jgi:hypothetical protein
MNYLTASLKLFGRCKVQRKLCNNTYLIRRSSEEIAVRLHSTDVITFHSDGRIDIATGGWDTVTTKDRINSFCAVRVWSEHGYMFASHSGQEIAFSGSARIMPDGKLIGKDAAAKRKEIQEEINERNRPRNRARYWVNKAREGKPYKGTVESILQEDNATVRLAKMRCYGMDKFFLDAKPTIVHEQAGYQLIELPLDTSWRKIRALKMACSTTGAVYINTVPEHLRDVPSALDWMFDTKV